MKFQDFLNEKKVTLKRRYTENHPAMEAGLTARVRNKMIEAVANGKLTQEEFNSILSELSNDSKRWMTRNAKYFNVSEDGITLSRFGKRVLKTFAINENEGFILEATRSQIGIIDKRGVIHSTYVHSDGYPEGVGQMAKDHFSDTKKMKELLKLGKNGISYLEPGIEGGEGHHFNTPIDGQTVFYGRDRGETRFDMTRKRKLEDLDDYLQDVANDGAEYVYLWDEKEKEWKYAVSKTRDGRQMGLQVLESELIEEDIVEGRNAFITAARAAKAEGLKEFEFKGKTFPVTVKDVSEEAPEVEETEEVTENKLVSESFGEFIASLNKKAINKVEENVNEAFKSAKLAQLFNTKVSGNWSDKGIKDLPNAFYNMAKVALDKVEDEDIIDMTAAEAHSTTRNDKNNRYVIFYIVDQEKENPYAEYEGQKTIPAGLLAIVKGNDFQGITWSRHTQRSGRTLATSEPMDSVGISKKYKGWDSTGLYNPKRISEVADRAVVLDTLILRDKYSTAGKIADRDAAKKGAIAFKSDKDFKRENMNRYKQILADKASKLPLDKMVKDAIDTLALQIQQGLAKGEIVNGEPILGINTRGSVVRMRDASNHMSQILDDYSKYVRYSNEATTALSSGYYEEMIKQEAKSIKDRIDKIEAMDYAW